MVGILIFALLVIIQSQAVTFENWEAVNQEETKRSVLGELKIEEMVFGLEQNGLFESAYFDSDIHDNLVAYDFPREKIMLFTNSDYKNPFELTEGRGRGPNELRMPRDLIISNDNHILITDSEGLKFEKWSFTNRLVYSNSKLNKLIKPDQITECGESIIITSSQYSNDGFYHIYDKNGLYKKSIGKITHDNKQKEKDLRSGYRVLGDIDCHNNDIIHVGLYQNYIRKINLDGNILYSVKVIEYEGNEEPLISTDGKWNSLNDNVVALSGNVEVFNDYLLISFGGKKGEWYYYLDVYSAISGNYEFSYKFSNPVKEFFISDEYIYTKEYNFNDHESYIIKYSIPTELYK